MPAPSIPLPPNVGVSVGSSLEESARVLKAQFGSGYAQRAGDGLNNIVGSYSVTFENLTRDEAAVIVQFFKTQGGARAFVFIPPGEEVERLWTCEKWKRTHVDATIDTVTASFEEVFTA